MRLPRDRRTWTVVLGAVALLAGAGIGIVQTRLSGPDSSLEVQAAGDPQSGGEDPLPGPGEQLSPSSTAPSPSSSSSSTTVTAPPAPTTTGPKLTTTTMATTTTTIEACAPAVPIYAFGLLRLPDGNGWVGAANPALRRTGDGGATWTSACLPASQVRGPGSVQSVDFDADGRHGWAVGASGGRLLTLRTVDGGDHWTAGALSTLADAAGTMNDVAFADTRHGWAVGHITGTGPANAGGGILLASRDGGATWDAQYLPADIGRLTRLSVVDATHAWAVGLTQAGRPAVLATTDGTAWTRLDLPDGIRELRDIAFVDRERGWAVGALPVPQPVQAGQEDPGVILATADGGATWTRQTETVGSLWSVDAVDSRTVYAGGGKGLFSTRDGGATWTKQPFALPALDSIDFTDADHGWVTHSMFSTVCRTDDGGRTWTPSDVRVGGKGTACLPG